jgi:hypothetical protein
MSAIKNYVGHTGAKLVFYTLHEGSTRIADFNQESTFLSLEDNGLNFNAFVTTFNQSFSSKWNQESVYGRNDPIATFQGTQRTMNLGFDIPSANLREAKENLMSLSSLTTMLYPEYSSSRLAVEKDPGQIIMVGSNALTLSKPPMLRLRYANLICDSAGKQPGLLGFISNLGITPVIDMGMFTHKKKLYPKVYSLTFDFTPLHEHDTGYTALKNLEGSTSGFPFSGD